MQARSLVCLAALSQTSSQVYVRQCLDVICCDGGAESCEWHHLSSRYGADATAFLLSDLLEAALCVHSQHSRVLAIAAADSLDAEQDSMHYTSLSRLGTCIRLAAIQHRYTSCAAKHQQGKKKIRRSKPRTSVLGIGGVSLPLTMCPECVGQHSDDFRLGVSSILRKLMTACVQIDRCGSCELYFWEDVLEECRTKGPRPVKRYGYESAYDDDWPHHVTRVWMGMEPWLQGFVFVEAAVKQRKRRRSTIAVIIAPHLLKPAYDQPSNASSQCWYLADCSSFGGSMGRIGVLLQAVGVQAVAVVVRDWMAFQAEVQQYGGTTELRRIVDDALTFAAKRRAIYHILDSKLYL
jgi:hypothetical protein